MIYSVSSGKGYAYFEGPGSFPATGRYRAPRGVPTKGMFTPEQFSVVLPPGSRQVGAGEMAKGIIAVRNTALGGFTESVSAAAPWGFAGLVGLVIGWLAGKRGR